MAEVRPSGMNAPGAAGAREETPMNGKIALGIIAAGMLAVCAPAWPADKDDAAELARALPAAKVTLEQGLKTSEREGKPISGKFEIEDGDLQLSYYTEKGGAFTEVIVDHVTGAIKKAEPITDAEDLQNAREQSQAMANAKLPLDEALQAALRANGGYRAVRVIPTLKGAQPVSDITLLKGTDTKKVTEKLD
jgi:hypothetical protein